MHRYVFRSNSGANVFVAPPNMRRFREAEKYKVPSTIDGSIGRGSRSSRDFSACAVS
jgi:hypothetical protein